LIRNIEKLTKSKFVRNVAVVATGTAGAQAIAMAFTPIITRLYGPEAFGLLGSFMAILAVLIPIAALTYPIAIVLPKSDRDALGLAKLSVILAFVMACLLVVIILFFGDKLAVLFNLESVAGFLLLIPIAMLFSAFQQVLQQWIIRKKQFSITSRIAVLQSLIINSAKAGMGFFYPIAFVLIVIASLGQALYAVLLWFGIQKSRTEESNKGDSVDSIKELAYRYKDFPLYRMPQVLISSLSMNAPVLMLTSIAGPSAAGFYALSKMVLGVPATLISKSVADVFYPKVTEAFNRNEAIHLMILKATLGLVVIGLIPLLVISLFGPFLFSFVFGGQWDIAGSYAGWLAIFMFFHFINTPSVSVISVLSMQRWFLIYSVFSASLRVSGLLIGYYLTNDPIGAVALFSILGSLAYVYLIVMVVFKSRAIVKYDIEW